MTEELGPVHKTRKSLRLPAYDYSQPGGYFVTIVTHRRELLFDTPQYRQIVEQVWLELPQRFPGVALDYYVVMPNHFHGILRIESTTVAAIHELPPPGRKARRTMLLPKAIGYFKMQTAKAINNLRATSGIPIWQRNYYEHVIRNEQDMDEIRRYIQDNPAAWELDAENAAWRS